METEIKYPKFLGCKMLGPEGAGCAAAGCWAQVLIKNAEDLVEPGKTQRIEQIRKEARESGCLNSKVTGIV